MKNVAPDVGLRYLRVAQMVAQIPPTAKSVAMILKTISRTSTNKRIVSELHFEFKYVTIIKVSLAHYHCSFWEAAFKGEIEGRQRWLCPRCRVGEYGVIWT